MTTGFWSFLSPSLFVFIPFYIYNVLLFHWGLLGINQGISHFNMDFIFFFFFLLQRMGWNVTWYGVSCLFFLFLCSFLRSFIFLEKKEQNLELLFLGYFL